MFQILGPILPGQEFPLPLHLAESGCMRWRPLGDSYLWSEAYNISSIISQDVRIGFLRNFVCYPSHPSNEAFRCCISVNGQCLPPVGKAKRAHSPVDVDSGKQFQNVHSQSSNKLEKPSNRFLYQVMLTSPLVLKNYLMKSISVTLEDAGVTRTAFLSQVWCGVCGLVEINCSTVLYIVRSAYVSLFLLGNCSLEFNVFSPIFRLKHLSTILILRMTCR